MARPNVPITNIIDPTEDAITGSSDASGGTGTAEVQSFDISGLPFRFNPPMHKLSRLVLVDLGEGKRYPGNSSASFYDEMLNEYSASTAVRKGDRKTGFENLRLGRIVMDDMAVSRGVIESGRRYGFRFLYNPAQLGGSLNVSTDFIPDQRSTGTYVLQKGLEQIQLEVLLNRIPDVNGNAKTSDYIPTISAYDRKQIQEQGTHYDLDFLYRCANGIHNTRSRSQTGDIGVLLPNPCRLILGPYTSRGAVVSVSVNDQMFSGSMVPILSWVNITFARFLNMTQDDEDRLTSYGITRGDDGGGSEGELSEDPDAAPADPRGGLSGKAVYTYARMAGFSPQEADMMTQIAYCESSWNPRAYNPKYPDDSYGLWQINMQGRMGPERRKAFGIRRNDELFDPATNARAARYIYKKQGFKAWTAYLNGCYRKVKVDWR